MSWGIFMFVLMGLLYPVVMGDALSLRSVGISISLWLLGGLGYGYAMHIYFRKKLSSQSFPVAKSPAMQQKKRSKPLTFDQKTILVILFLLVTMGIYFFVKSLARPEQWRMIASSVSLLGFGTLTILYLQYLQAGRNK